MFSVWQGEALDSEHLSELTEEEYDVNFVKPHLKRFPEVRRQISGTILNEKIYTEGKCNTHSL